MWSQGPKELGLFLAHWQVSQFLESDCRAQGFQSSFQVIDGRELVPDTGVESRVSQSLHWLASGQDQGPAGPRVGSVLLWVGWVCRLWDHNFLTSSIWLLVMKPIYRLVQASWREGLVPADWWVGLSLGPLVAVSVSPG